MFYIKLEWSEIQEFMMDEDYDKEVFFDPDKNVWFVSKDYYIKVLNL